MRNPGENNWNKEKHLAIRTLLILLITINFIHFLSDHLLTEFHIEPKFAELLDSFLNIILTFPLLYIFVFIPIRNYTFKLRQAIDDLKLAKEIALETEANFRSIFENNSTAMAIVEPDQTISYINDEYCKMSGYDRHEIIGGFWDRLITPKDLDRLLDYNRRRLNNTGDAPEKYEFSYYHKDGKVRHGLMSVSLLLNKRIIASITDITEQKSLDRKLKAERDRGIDILEKMSDAFVSLDRNWCYTYMNEKAGKIEGRDPKEMIGRNIWIEHPEAIGFPFQLNYQKAMNEKVFIRMEEYYPPRDKWFENRINPTAEGIAIFYNDITERKHTEEALKESEERLTRAIAGSPVPIMIYDEEFEVLQLSMGWTKFSGYTIEDIPTIRDWTEKAYGVRNETNNEFVKNLFSIDSTVDTGEWIIKTKDGSQRIWNFQATPLGKIHKGKRVMHSMAVDITEQKRAEQELIIAKEKTEESQKQLILRNEELIKNNTFIQTILDNLPIGLALNQIDCGEAIYMNKKFEEIYGWKFGEITSVTTFFEKVYPDENYRKHIIERIMNDINSGDSDQMHWENVRITNKDGSHRIVDAVNIPLIHQNIMVSTVMDITRMHQIQNDLILAKEHAEESDRLKSAFLANMSHEIRTPMNGIIGFADLLKEPRLSTEEQKEYISLIELSGARMLNIINDIVDISKIESGQMTINMTESNINDQIEYVYTFFKPEVEQKGMHFSFKNGLLSKESVIRTDREKVFAILINLVKNAIKYSDAGAIEFGYVLNSSGETSMLEFFVKDQGVGIPINRQKAIFERFVQADTGDKRAYQGAGLGLAISKNYVEMLGGTIWVISEPAKGSTFYFTLPYHTALQDKTELKGNTKVNKSENISNNLKTLIAEDDQFSERLISITARKFSKQIWNAGTGTETVDICRNNPDIDLILMDIQMPEMNGYEATMRIREFNSEVIIIAQTAYGLSGDREKAIEAGCNDYISKPIDKDELLALILKYFKNLLI